MLHEVRNSFDTAVRSPESSSLSVFQRDVVPHVYLERLSSLPTANLETFAGNPELRAAVDSAQTISLGTQRQESQRQESQPAGSQHDKSQREDSNDVDVLVKRDGTVEHYLNLNETIDQNKKLVIAFEQESDGEPLTDGQSVVLKQLMDYMNVSNKSVELEPALLERVAGATETPPARSTEPAPRRAGSPHLPGSSQFGAGPDARRNAFPSRWSDQGGQGTDSDTIPDYPDNQVDLFEFLMQLFNSNEETFKKLMPGLYKKVVGANGKIDAGKLRKLVDSKDPEVESLKKQFPQFGDSQKSDKASASTSCDAVNKTGAVLAEKAEEVSGELGSTGYCAKGVSFAIERATGKVIWGNANDMRESLPGEGFKVADNKNLKVGQVVHVYWTPEVYAQEQARRGPCPNYGDIAIIGKGHDGQLYAYNDAATPLDNYLQKSRYDWSTLKVFNPPNS